MFKIVPLFCVQRNILGYHVTTKVTDKYGGKFIPSNRSVKLLCVQNLESNFPCQTGPCPEFGDFFSLVWINSMFADSQVILKLIIKPSKPEP